MAKLARHLALAVLAALALGAATARAAAPPAERPIGVVESSSGDGPGLFSSLDPVSLEPAEPAAELPEWHGGYSFSPDRSQAAFGISTGAPVNAGPGTRRVGVRMVDVATRQIVGDVRLGVYAQSVAWLEPDRIVALRSGGGSAALIDPVARTVVGSRRVPTSGCLDPPWGQTRRALVSLSGRRVVTVDRDGNGRSVTLRELPDDCALNSRARRSGLAFDAAGERAFVVGTGRTVPEVDLRAMRVRRHTVPASTARSVRYSRGLWLGGRKVAVAHQDSRGRPRGVDLLDPPAGRRRALDRGAGGVAFAAGRVLTFDGRRHALPATETSTGLRAWTTGGRQRYRVLAGQRVFDLAVAGDYAYARVPSGVRVVHVPTGEIVGSAALPEHSAISLLAP